MSIARLCAAVTVVLFCAAASPPETSLTSKEKTMLQRDVSGGAYEQQLSALALKKSSNPKIRAFAETGVRDHTALIKEARQIAGQGGDAPQADLTIQDKQKMASRSMQNGRAFDDAFAQAMGAVNEEDKRSFAADEKDASSPEVKQYLQHSHDIDAKHESMLQGLHVGY